MKRKNRVLQDLQEQYLNFLVQGEAYAASSVIEEALEQDKNLIELYLYILAPALVEIGELWHKGEINIAQEHLATQITFDQMEKLRQKFKAKIKLGLRAIVTTVEKEMHSIGARMVADFLSLNGWDVDYLGADIPCQDLVDFVRKRQPDLVAISVTLPNCLPHTAKTIKALRCLPNQPKILIGGAALSEQNQVVENLGADSTAGDALEAVREAHRLLGISDKEGTLEQYLKKVGKRLQKLRKGKSWSQQQLANSSGLDRTYISAMEHGKQNVTIGALYKLANALKISVDQFLIDSADETILLFDENVNLAE